LALCQRYFERITAAFNSSIAGGYGYITYVYKQQKRVTPTITLVRFNTRGIDGFWYSGAPTVPTYYNCTSVGSGDITDVQASWAFLATGGTGVNVSSAAFNQLQDSYVNISAEL
jgi:hypothetical protein